MTNHEKRIREYLFVYGTLKKGFCNNYLLGTSTFIDKAFTEDLTMYDGRAYPACKLEKTKEGEFPVEGELYLIKDHITQMTIDHLEGVPYLFKKEKIFVETEGGLLQEASVYVMANEENFINFTKNDTGNFKRKDFYL